MWRKKRKCAGRSGESFGSGKLFSYGCKLKLPELASEISLLGWHLPANTLPSHCSLIRANPSELQILEWFWLKCILGGRRWWLKGILATGLYHAVLGAILTGPELLSGQFGRLVTEKAAVYSPERWNFTAVFAVGQQVLPKELAVLDISFHTHGIFRDFFFLCLILTKGKLCSFEAFCVRRTKT